MSRSRSARDRLPLFQRAHPALKRADALQRRGHDRRSRLGQALSHGRLLSPQPTLAMAAISGQAWWYHPTTPTTEITMDQEVAQRLATLEGALVEQNRQIGEQQRQIVDMANALNSLTEANNSSFEGLLTKEFKDMGTDVVQQTIINGLLARSDEATKRDVQASLQVAYEAFGEKIPDPHFLRQFEAAADAAFPGIRLEPAAD